MDSPCNGRGVVVTMRLARHNEGAAKRSDRNRQQGRREERAAHASTSQWERVHIKTVV